MGWKSIEITQEGKTVRLSATDSSGKTDEYICGYREWKKNAHGIKPA